MLAELPKRLKCAVVTKEESARLPDVGTPRERYRAAGLDLDRLRSLDERQGLTEMSLRTADGREIVLGTEEDVQGALAEMAAATGGSSERGRWSSLFGLKAEDAMPTDQADRLALEAEADGGTARPPGGAQRLTRARAKQTYPARPPP